VKQGYGTMEKEQRKKSNVVGIHPREVPSSRVRRAYAYAVDPSVCLSVFHCTVPFTKPIAICLRIIVMKSSVWNILVLQFRQNCMLTESGTVLQFS